MIPLLRKIRETIVQHRLLTTDERVLVGVSGGADSTTLLLALHELGYKVSAAHLNHRLRGNESEADQQFVCDLAGRLNIPVFVKSVSLLGSVGNLEATGREARREFFQSLLQEHQFSKIALAHNREDRVETFLLHLMRGAGGEGLISMGPASGNIVRPLIDVSRSEVEAYLSERGQPWRTDSSNLDISFARNRIRLEILPGLASLFNARLADSLTRTIEILQDESDWMDSIAQEWLGRHGDECLDTAALRQAHPALARRLIRHMLRQHNPSLTDISFDRIEAVRSLLEDGKSGKSIQLPGGLVARREFNELIFSDSAVETVEFDYDLSIPGTVHVPELGLEFRASVVEGPLSSLAPLDGSNRVLVDGGRVGACVKIRNWKPGDYYKPAGWPAGKVKKLFQRARIPRSQRSRWPLFATDSAIIWVTSFPVSREFTPAASAKKIVAFEALGG